MKRLTSLKEMILWLQPQGISFSKFCNYGCHCLPGGFKYVDMSGSGKPVDSIDSACQVQTKCHECAKLEFNNCDPTSELYNFALRYEETAAYDLSKRDIVCLDQYSQDPCKRASCECDRGLAMRMFQNANLWSQDFYHPSGFDFYRTCVDSSSFDFRSSEENSFDGIDFSRSFTFETGKSLIEQERIEKSIYELFGGGNDEKGVEKFDFGGNLQARSNFQVKTKTKKENNFEVRCCGDYSDGSRHKFKASETRSCCGSRTYDNRLFQCCGKSVVSVGTC